MRETLIEFVSSNEKICPEPGHWNEFYKLLLREAKIKDVTEKVPIPFVLGAWEGSTEFEKRQRLIEQIVFSQKYEFLEITELFLRSLKDSAWNKCPEDLIDSTSSYLELSHQDWDDQQKLMKEAKKFYAELIEIEKNSIYDEEFFGSYMSSFSFMHDDPNTSLPTYSQILKSKIKEYEGLELYIDEFEKEYWEQDIISSKVTVLKLELCRLCKEHEELDGNDGMLDFCKELF